jgi:hypothetical protein
LGKSSQVRLRQPRHFQLQFPNAHGGNLMRPAPVCKPNANSCLMPICERKTENGLEK